jgi:hypothetical protein
MGFFAVLGDHSSVHVARMDINIWCLPGLLGRRVLYCDIGLELQALDEDISSIDVVLPFTVDPEPTDLTHLLVNAETASLVFGEPLSSETDADNHTTLKFAASGPEGSALQGAEVTAVNGPAAEIPSSTDSSLRLLRTHGIDEVKINAHNEAHSPVVYRLTFDSLPNETSGYVRVRFPMMKYDRVWVWQPTRHRRRRATVDVRIADLRQAATSGLEFAQTVLAVKRANVFVVTPSSLFARHASPELRYTRLLEGQRWEAYLERRTDWRRRGKLVVSFWRKEDVRRDNEFRGWLDLASNRRPIQWATAAVTGIFTYLLFFLFNSPFSRSSDGKIQPQNRIAWLSHVLKIFPWMGHHLTWSAILLTITVILTAIGAFPTFKPVTAIRRLARNSGRWIESIFFSA